MAILTSVMAVISIMMQYEPLAVQVIKTGLDLKVFAESLYKQFKGSELTIAERTELRAAVDAQYDKFMRPQLPAQPGDPDYVKPV